MSKKEELVQKLIKTIIAEEGGIVDENGIKKIKDPSGVFAIKTKTVRAQSWGDKGVYLTQATSVEETPRMGCGVMELDGTGSLDWTLTYDEYDYVIDGILEIQVDGRSVIGTEGDIIYIPKGTHVVFNTPSSTRYAYFAYPIDAVEEIL